MRAATVIHPVPTALNAAVVLTLALVAGATPALALTLALAMLGFQTAIGAVNDIVDADADRLVKPAKPIPAGTISPAAAMVVATAGVLTGLLTSFAIGPAVGVLGAAGLAIGLLYDVLPRRWAVGWLLYVPAFPLLLAWTWMASVGELPPAWPLIFPVAALAGPMVSLANGLVDREGDLRTNRSGLAVALGQRRGWRVLAILTVSVHGLAWATLLAFAARPLGPLTLLVGAAGTLMATIGLAASASAGARRREAGWLLSAGGLGALGVAWVAAVDAAT